MLGPSAEEVVFVAKVEIADALARVESVDLLDLFFSELEIVDLDVLLNMSKALAARDRNSAPGNRPVKHDLCLSLAVTLAYGLEALSLQMGIFLGT